MTKLNGVKNAIMQVTYFLNGPMFNLLHFIVILFYIDWKWLLLRNLAIILLLKSKLSGKFYRFNGIDESIEILKNSWISKNFIKVKNCKTFYETQTASHLKEVFSLPPPLILPDILLRLWNKNVLKETYRNIQTFAFKVHQEIVQCKCFFWHQTETYLLENL